MLDQDFYCQTKTTIGFWYRRGLNPRSLIQQSEILPVELTRTHPYFLIYWDIIKMILLVDVLLTHKFYLWNWINDWFLVFLMFIDIWLVIFLVFMERVWSLLRAFWSNNTKWAWGPQNSSQIWSPKVADFHANLWLIGND